MLRLQPRAMELVESVLRPNRAMSNKDSRLMDFSQTMAIRLLSNEQQQISSRNLVRVPMFKSTNFRLRRLWERLVVSHSEAP